MDQTIEQVLGRILTIFTTGFFTIGIVLALLEVGDCGSVFDPSDACSDGQLAGRQAMVVAFFGLAVTGLVAAALMPVKPRNPDDEAYSDGARI